MCIRDREILSTPLQIANLGATIANRGYFVTPHIVKEIQDNQLDSIYCVPRYTTIEKRHYAVSYTHLDVYKRQMERLLRTGDQR